MTNCVIAGSGLLPSMSWKICWNFGTMNTSRNARITNAITMTTTG